MNTIDMYLTDVITIITVTKDKFGVSTTTTSTGISARVELGNTFTKNDRGEEVMGKGLIIFNFSRSITYEDRIKIQTINGVAYNRTAKEFSILSIEKGHGFESTHYEVIIG